MTRTRANAMVSGRRTGRRIVPISRARLAPRHTLSALTKRSFVWSDHKTTLLQPAATLFIYITFTDFVQNSYSAIVSSSPPLTESAGVWVDRRQDATTNRTVDATTSGRHYHVSSVWINNERTVAIKTALIVLRGCRTKIRHSEHMSYLLNKAHIHTKA